VKLLAQLARGGDACVSQLASTGLLATCEPLLLDEDTGTAETAAGVLHSVVECPVGCQAVLGAGGDDTGLAGRLQARLRGLGDVERIRVLHLFVELGHHSEEAFGALQERGVYKEVLGSFLTDDILLKLNAVELMDALGSFPAGQAYLGQQGLPAQLARELQDPMCDASVRLCLARLLGFVLLRTPSAFDALLPGKEAPFAQTVAALLDSRDPAERLCALNAWGNASAHSAGLTFFLNWPPLLQEVISLAASPQNEVCKGAMACWAAVLQGRAPPDGGALDSPEAALWSVAETRLLPLVLKNLPGKPFPDVRELTWRLLSVLVVSRSCAQRILPSEEMRNVLLDFTSETTSDARRSKYDFVAALVRHKWIGSFLDAEVEELLAEYARQGPHWVPRDASAKVGDQSGA